MGKIFLTQKQKFALGQELSKHCITNDAGLAVYAQGFDDEKIAVIMGEPVKPIHVRGLRRELFGSLHKAAKPGTGKSADSRITAIENYLTSKNPNWRLISES